MKISELKKLKNFNLTLQNFRGNLRNYQKVGVAFISNIKNVLLADEQGLGKFIQFLGSIIYLKEKKQQKNKILFVTLASIKFQGLNEIAKFTDDYFKTKIIKSKMKKSEREKLWISDYEIMIVNYEILYRDAKFISENFDKIKFNFICLDECTILRNYNKTHWQIKLVVDKILTQENHRILLMTGSPISKSIYEIYTLFSLTGISYKLFGGEYQFRKDYCIERNINIGTKIIKEIIGYKNIEKFSSQIDKYILRRRTNDVIEELPEKIYHTLIPELTERQNEIYNLIISNENYNGLQTISFLRSVCDLPATLPKKVFAELGLKYCKEDFQSCKLIELERIIENTKGQILLFDCSKKVINYLYYYFSKIKKIRCLKISGDYSDEEKEKTKIDFKTHTDIKILFATDCLSFGANLQNASTVIQYRVSWSSIIDEQRIKRIDRLNQQSKILNIYNILCSDTIEERVADILNKDKKLAQKVFNDNDIINYINYKKII